MQNNIAIIPARMGSRRIKRKNIKLYCVSGYPTKESETNMETIKEFKSIFKKYIIGISDHTNNIYSSLSATALGAVVIEKHFILNKKIKSLDKTFSIDSIQLKNLREITKKIHSSLGKIIIGPKKNELNSLKLRRSIFTIKNIKKDEKFSKKNIGCFRPKIGIGAEKYFQILGKVSNKNLLKNSPLKVGDLAK